MTSTSTSAPHLPAQIVAGEVTRSQAIRSSSSSQTSSHATRSKDRPSPFFEAAKVSSVGLEMGVAIGIGWGLGYWLDGKYGTGPWLMLVGLLFGVGAGFNGLIRTTRQVNANAAQNALEAAANNSSNNSLSNNSSSNNSSGAN